MTKKASRRRIRIKNEFQSLRIEIPVKTKWFIIVLLLIFNLKILFSVFSKSLKYSMEDLFYDMEYALYLMFTVLVIFVLGSVLVTLWLLFGKEVIHVEKGILKIKKSLFGIGNQKAYEINKIKNMRIEIQKEMESKNRENGKIKFDYDNKTIRFASDVDDVEAEKILDALKNNIYFNKENFQNNTL